MKAKYVMQPIITTLTRPLTLLLTTVGTLCGQEAIRVTFDRYQMPPGTVWSNGSYYAESSVQAEGRFTLRWSGDPLFPDNGTAYLQPSGGELFFVYRGATRSFDAVSVDLALYSVSSLEPVTVQFAASGYSRRQDIIATAQFTVAGVVDVQGRPTFQTFYFPPEFRGMYYLSVTPTAPLWSLDNLVVFIPEPASGTLLLFGALGLWLLRRQHLGEGGVSHASNVVQVSGDCQP